MGISHETRVKFLERYHDDWNHAKELMLAANEELLHVWHNAEDSEHIDWSDVECAVQMAQEARDAWAKAEALEIQIVNGCREQGAEVRHTDVGRLFDVEGSFGQVLASDVGKRVWFHDEVGIVMENAEQRDERRGW